MDPSCSNLQQHLHYVFLTKSKIIATYLPSKVAKEFEHTNPIDIFTSRKKRKIGACITSASTNSIN